MKTKATSIGSALRKPEHILSIESAPDNEVANRVLYVAYAKSVGLDNNLRLFTDECVSFLKKDLGELLPSPLSGISQHLWLYAAKSVSRLQVWNNNKTYEFFIQSRRERAEKIAKKSKTSKTVSNNFSKGDMVTPVRWHHKTYVRWTKTVVELDGLTLVVYGNKRVSAFEMRIATKEETARYFNHLKNNKAINYSNI